MELSQDYRSKPLAFAYGLASQLRPSPQSSSPEASTSSTLAPPSGDARASIQSNGLVRASLEGGVIDILAHYADDYGQAEGDRWYEAHDPSPVHPHFSSHHQQHSTSTFASSLSPKIHVISASNSFLDLGDERRESLVLERGEGQPFAEEQRRTQLSLASAKGRESTFSAMTTASTETMDPFQYSKYSASSPTELSFSHKHSNSLSPIVELNSTSRTAPRTPPKTQAPLPAPATPPPLAPLPPIEPLRTPPRQHAPELHIASPSPTHAPFPPRTSSSPRSPPTGSPGKSVGLGLTASPSSTPAPLPPAGPTPSFVTQTTPAIPPGRAPSRAPLAKNYSRPIFARPVNAPSLAPAPPPPPPVNPSPSPGPSARERERELSAGSCSSSRSPPVVYLPSHRVSLDSINGVPVSSVGHGSITSASHAEGASSVGHSDATGGTSVLSHTQSFSPMWEDKQNPHQAGPSFERLPLENSPRVSQGQVEEIRSGLGASTGSPVMSETYGTLYPAGSPGMSDSSPALEPPPMSRGPSATSSSGASSVGGTGSPRSTSHGRNVLRKARPQPAPQSPPPFGATSPPKAAEGGWRFRGRKESPKPPTAISHPELQSSSADPRASFGTTHTHASQMSYVPQTTREWGLPLDVARQRADERHRVEGMRLQPGAGRKAGAGFVQRGDEGVGQEWLAVEEGEEEVESLQGLGLEVPQRRRIESNASNSSLDLPNFSPARSRAPSEEGGKAGSVYSDYSYYGIPPSSAGDSKLPSPLGTSFQQQQGSRSLQRQSTTLEKTKLGMSGGRAPKLVRTPAEATAPEEFLQLGIDFHEAGELERSAWCFEQSTKREGGCPAGYLMYGLTLRHGWGCQMQPELGFAHLQKAAESVLPSLSPSLRKASHEKKSSLVLRLPQAEDLPDLSTQKAAKTAVTLALYEMGTSLRFGWGVPKDKKVALQYFTLSAELGDVDAQQEVAFMLANGKGCKKDKKSAARFYRMAVEQGAPSFGLSWIWKAKYVHG